MRRTHNLLLFLFALVLLLIFLRLKFPSPTQINQLTSQLVNLSPTPFIPSPTPTPTPVAHTYTTSSGRFRFTYPLTWVIATPSAQLNLEQFTLTAPPASNSAATFAFNLKQVTKPPPLTCPSGSDSCRLQTFNGVTYQIKLIEFTDQKAVLTYQATASGTLLGITGTLIGNQNSLGPIVIAWDNITQSFTWLPQPNPTPTPPTLIP